MPNSTLSSSLNSLCLRLRPHQLLPEFNDNIARSSDQHEFNWWNTAAHIKPLIQQVILRPKFTNEFIEDKEKEETSLIEFSNCRRNQRQNAICSDIDKRFFIINR